MSSQSAMAAAALVPLVRYRDVGTAIDWLCNAFGFEKHAVVTGDDGNIIYAQLRCGKGLIMVCPAEGSGLDAVMRQPDEIGRAATQCCYLVIANADGHYRRAMRAGAELVHDGQSDSDGRRGYTCRDPEGHLWSFGTFDPWRNHAASQKPEPGWLNAAWLSPAWLDIARLNVSWLDAAWPDWRSSRVLQRGAAVAALVLGTSAAAAFMYPSADEGEQISRTMPNIEQQLVQRNTEQTARKLLSQLGAERQAKDAAVRASEARKAEIESLKAELEKTRDAKDKAAAAASESREQLAKAQSAVQSWMLRAEEAEAKAAAADGAQPSEARVAASTARPGDIETGSPPPAAGEPSAAPQIVAPKPAPPAAAADTVRTVVIRRCARPRYVRARIVRPRYIMVEKDWSSFAAW